MTLFLLMNLDFAGGVEAVVANPLSVIRMSGEAITVISMSGVYAPAVPTAGEAVTTIPFSGYVEESD